MPNTAGTIVVDVDTRLAPHTIGRIAGVALSLVVISALVITLAVLCAAGIIALCQALGLAL